MNQQLLLVGLGNPGPKYQNTRHNIGFMIIDELAKEFGISWKDEKKYQHQKLKLNENINIHFLKPMEYMNLSGSAVVSIINLYKISANNVLVIHDEIDFVFGKIKLKFGGGHAGHNGLKDIIQKLGTNDFHRLRFGVGRPENSFIDVADFVLSPFKEQEKLELPKLIQISKDKILGWIKDSQKKLTSI
ncbi:MAG: aminoacyl-tRNA hydrolase [Leptospiraceae bacterium]|nr:aminoacyl-tRNA hydrolase [Leptospiraceae bacterium]